MSFRLFLTVLWPLHNLLHSMIRRLRSHRSLGLMVHSSPVFHDRVPNMEVPATFAHDNGQVLWGFLGSAFLLAVVCNVSIPPVPVQVISPLNEQLVVPVLRWLHRNRVLAHRAPRTGHQAHRAQGTGHLPIRSYSPALISLASRSMKNLGRPLPHVLVTRLPPRRGLVGSEVAVGRGVNPKRAFVLVSCFVLANRHLVIRRHTFTKLLR